MVGWENREDRSSALAWDRPLLPHAQWPLYRMSKSAVDAIHFWHRCRHSLLVSFPPGLLGELCLVLDSKLKEQY